MTIPPLYRTSTPRPFFSSAGVAERSVQASGPIGGDDFRKHVRKIDDEAGKRGLTPAPLPSDIPPSDDDNRPPDQPIIVIVPPPPVPPPPPLPPLF